MGSLAVFKRINNDGLFRFVSFRFRLALVALNTIGFGSIDGFVD